MSRGRRAAVLDWAIPIVLLIAATIPFYRTDIDVRIARHFYVPGRGFPIGAEPLWWWCKHYGVIPAWVLACSALGVFIASFIRPRLRAARRGAIFLVFVMAFGPGLIVNDVFKEHWGRPRPRDLVEMGGTKEYVPPLVKSPRENGGSFCSGHAATGFYLLTPYFLLRRRARWKAAAVLGVGLVYGSLMGYARIAQGAHFLSDIVWSLGIVYLSALALFYLVGVYNEPNARSDA
jgi:membrane-associated PAP2 superfamily phosphatase